MPLLNFSWVASRAEPEDQRQFLRAHIAALRAVPQYKRSYIIFFGEANLGLEAAHLAEYIHTLRGRNYVYSESERVGVMTTHEKKEAFVSRAEDYLDMEDSIRFAEPLVCANPFLLKKMTQRDLVNKMRKTFSQQISRFKKIVYIPQNAYGKVRISYSGKVDAENKINARFKDDLMMAWLISMFYGTLFLRRKLPNIPYAELFSGNRR